MGQILRLGLQEGPIYIRYIRHLEGHDPRDPARLRADKPWVSAIFLIENGWIAT